MEVSRRKFLDVWNGADRYSLGAYYCFSAATHRLITIPLSKYADARVFGAQTPALLWGVPKLTNHQLWITVLRQRHASLDLCMMRLAHTCGLWKTSTSLRRTSLWLVIVLEAA